MNALKEGNDLKGTTLFHIKVKGGHPEASERNTCDQCSKLILQSGIAWIVLWHRKGYTLYTTQEVYENSMKIAKDGHGGFVQS